MSKLQKKNILRSFCWFYLHYPIFLSSRDAYFVCYGSRKMTTFCNKNLKLQNFNSKTPQKHTRRITMSRLHTAYVLPTYKSILKHYNYVLDTVVYSPDSARYSNKTSEFCRVYMKIRWRRSNILAFVCIIERHVCMKSKQIYYELRGDSWFLVIFVDISHVSLAALPVYDLSVSKNENYETGTEVLRIEVYSIFIFSSFFV